MKWNRAMHHLESLVHTCADMATRPSSIFPLRVVQLWALDDVLGEPRDFDLVRVALVVDLPADDVPWLDEPPGSHHWASATRLNKNPVRAFWRSAHAPVWNHYLDRPVLLWDVTDGVVEPALAAIKDGRGDSVRPPAPTQDELRARLHEELRISLRALRVRNREYDERRWSPGKLTPVADALWRAIDGYLDVLDALEDVKAG